MGFLWPHKFSPCCSLMPKIPLTRIELFLSFPSFPSYLCSYYSVPPSYCALLPPAISIHQNNTQLQDSVQKLSCSWGHPMSFWTRNSLSLLFSPTAFGHLQGVKVYHSYNQAWLHSLTKGVRSWQPFCLTEPPRPSPMSSPIPGICHLIIFLGLNLTCKLSPSYTPTYSTISRV